MAVRERTGQKGVMGGIGMEEVGEVGEAEAEQRKERVLGAVRRLVGRE